MRGVVGFFTFAVAIMSLIASSSAVTKTQKDFDKWRVECIENDTGAKKCSVFYTLIDNKTKAVVFGWSIVPGEKPNTNKVVIRSLTGISVPDGLVAKFPNVDPVLIPYKTCLPKFCLSEVPFSDSWLKTFKSNQQFEIALKAANGKEVKYQIDLTKFGDAFDYYASLLKPQ